MKKNKNKKSSFPDLSGDGKTTFKDVLIGRGVKLNMGGMAKDKRSSFMGGGIAYAGGGKAMKRGKV